MVPTSPQLTRGSRSDTSVEFDLAKIQHSFLLELARRRHYSVSATFASHEIEFTYRFDDDSGVQPFVSAWLAFADRLEGNQALGALPEYGGSWREHVQLAEAINYASDAIHRIATDPSGHDSLLYYLIATETLNRFLDGQRLTP